MAAKKVVKSTRKRYRPKALKQTLRFEGKLYGCTDTAFAMCVDAATLGGERVTEAEVRALSNEANPNPDSPGLNLNQLEAVARKLHVEFTSMAGHSWADLVAALRANRRVVAQLWYPDLGGGAIGHAVYVDHQYKGNSLIVDPVKGKFTIVPNKTLLKAMQSFATRGGLKTGLYWGVTRATPWMSVNQKGQSASS